MSPLEFAMGLTGLALQVAILYYLAALYYDVRMPPKKMPKKTYETVDPVNIK